MSNATGSYCAANGKIDFLSEDVVKMQVVKSGGNVNKLFKLT